MKRNDKFVFSDLFAQKRQSEVLNCIVDAIENAGEVNVDLSCRISAARRYISKPVISDLKLICSPYEYRGELDCYCHAQLAALFKKRADVELGIDRKDVALNQFLLSEKLCRETNRKLKSRDDAQYARRATLIYEMSRKISRVLGPAPSLDSINFGFGPGANVDCNQYTTPRWKLSAGATTTEAALRLLIESRHSTHAWPGLCNTRLVSGSYWTSVPKTSLTDRGINVEPIVNSYLQKGLGSEIRDRLLRVGIDLTDQSANQRLAREASVSGKLATIDLSMASDLISYLLVLDLLPYDWFELLDHVRSPVCRLPDGKLVVLEKFSSMGNGATFELESLIFWALLAVVCGERDISVYGDDLICPVEFYSEVLENLTLLGFIPNPEKSFGSGKFRESCGKDYWDGTDVRPVFIKDSLSVKEIFRLHNFFVRSGRFEDLPPRLLNFVPREHRRYGPDGFGDGHLLWGHNAPRCKVDKRGWEPFHLVKTWVAKPRSVRTPLSSDYGAFIYARANGRKPVSDESYESTMYNVRSRSPQYRLITIRTPWRS